MANNYREKFSVDELRECYIEKKMSLRAIAAHFHCSPNTIQKVMKQEGIASRTAKMVAEMRRSDLDYLAPIKPQKEDKFATASLNEHLTPDCQCLRKKCSKCKNILCCQYFGPDKKTKSGLRSHCYPCKRKEGREYHSKHKETINGVKRERTKNDPLYRERAHASSRKYHRTHKEEEYARRRRYSIVKPEFEKNRKLIRKEREDAAPGFFTKEEWKAMQVYYDHKCVCCKRSGLRLYPDHVIPVALNGSHDANNRQPLCTSCNSRKGTQIIDYRINFFQDGSAAV